MQNQLQFRFDPIQENDSNAETVYDSRYTSKRELNDSFQNLLGFSPQKSNYKNHLTVTRIATPLGLMLTGATGQGISLFDFIDRRMIETHLKTLKKLFSAELVPGKSEYFPIVEKQIQEYYTGTRTQFDFPLDLKGTEFQMKVWKELQRVPYGETRTYKDQAIAIGNIKAIRAVARANGENRMAIVIPCHRVIGEDGNLTGYGGGLSRKQYLLDLEKRNF